MNLLTAIPGLGSAISGFQKTISQLDLLKTDKGSVVDAARVEIEAHLNVFRQAQEVFDLGEQLIKQSESVLTEARGAVSSLLSTICGAGVGVYRFDGNPATMGGELQEAMKQHEQSGQVTALILVASDGNALAALRKVFRLG